MFIPYIAGMFTMFFILIYNEIYNDIYVSKNLFIQNQTSILDQDKLYFPYETTYLRDTKRKFNEFESFLYFLIKSLVKQ